MSNLDTKEKLVASNMFFYHRIYLNGKQILLDDKILENLNQILDELKPKKLDDLKELYKEKNIKKIFGNFIPDDSELLENTENLNPNPHLSENDLTQFYYRMLPIYNFFSPSQYTKINKEPPLFHFSDLKIIEKCEKFNILEFQHSKDIEKDIKTFFDKNKENKKDIEKDFYTILIIGNEEFNIKFINGFLNFLFDIKEDDNYRLILNPNYEIKANFFATNVINSEKGKFLFFFININNKNNFELKAMIEFFKNIEKEAINLILFNMYEAPFEPIIQINESEKNDMFFACPSVSFNMLKCHVLEEQFNFFEKFQLIKENKADEKLIKETIIEMIKHDKLVRQKYTSCYLNYDCIYDPHKNQDIFFKYAITMEGYQYFYNIITNHKNKFIDFSSLIKYLLIIEEKEKDIKKLGNYLKEKKGEDWTEYHIYDIKIKNLEKENEAKKKEIKDLEEQKKENSNDYNNKIKKSNEEIDNLRFYKTNIQKDASMFLPISSEKIGNKLHEGNYTHVCQKCKYNCHIECDEIIKKFCKCFKLTLSGLKCKVCPNKCYSDSHEVVYYRYPKYEYKKIDDILKIYYKDEYPKKKSAISKIDYLIELKEEEKRTLKKNYEKGENTLDILIGENNNIIKSHLETIEIVKDKKDKIYDTYRRKIENEIEKVNSYVEQLGKENLKPYEKLFIESLKEDYSPSSGGGKCC